MMSARSMFADCLCRQWSWPLWLPVQFFGIFPDSTLIDNDSKAPWSDELEQKLFSSAVGEQLTTTPSYLAVVPASAHADSAQSVRDCRAADCIQMRSPGMQTVPCKTCRCGQV